MTAKGGPSDEPKHLQINSSTAMQTSGRLEAYPQLVQGAHACQRSLRPLGYQIVTSDPGNRSARPDEIAEGRNLRPHRTRHETLGVQRIRRDGANCGLLQSWNTASKMLRIMSTSATITASRLSLLPSALRINAMTPTPVRMTQTPASTGKRMGLMSRMNTGKGDGTTRRNPLLAHRHTSGHGQS